MNTSVFRKASVDRLSSPEQLDQLLSITSSKGWLGLAALAGLIGVALTWGVAGWVHTRVQGSGVLVRSGGILSVTSATGGRVVDVSVRPGDAIREGQVVARLQQPELAEAVTQARARLEDLRLQHAELVTLGTQESRAEGDLLTQQRTSADREIRSAEERAAWLRDRVRSQERLVQDGLLTQQQLQATRRDLQVTTEQAERLRGDPEGLRARRVTQDGARTKQAAQVRLQIGEAQREIERLEAQYERAVEVVSPYTGRVLELTVYGGDLVTAGGSIARIDRTDDDVDELEAVVYVAATEGKKLQPGMSVQIAPTSFKREEFGTIRARVVSVSDYPATQEAMQRALGNAQLVQTLSGGGAPYEVRVSLELDPTTPSGYAWSSSRGPSAAIQTGTVCAATVTVEQQRPLTLALPFLRRLTGV